MSEVAHDRRLLRGAQSRRTIVRHAVDVASLDGLDGLSFGRLATDLGVSKGGIQTLFGTKETLQVAVAEAAGEAFEEAVTRPPRAAARCRAAPRPGRPVDRLRAGTAVPRRLLLGSQPARLRQPARPVRDTLARQQRAWRSLIAAELRHAAGTGQIAAFDADLVAFQIDAVLTAANTALRLGDDSAVDTARRIINGLLAPPG